MTRPAFRFQNFCRVGRSLPSFNRRPDVWYRFQISSAFPECRPAFFSTQTRGEEKNITVEGYFTSKITSVKSKEKKSFLRSESFSGKTEHRDDTDVKYWLKQSSWMNRHPVDKLSLLKRIGESAPNLLLHEEGKNELKKKKTDDGRTGETETNPGEELVAAHHEKGIFLSTSGEELVSYAARLQICLSLEMWVRGISEMQDSVARLRLPYSPSRRMIASPSSAFYASAYHKNRPTTGRRGEPSLIMRPFPTRKMEYLVDPYTTIELRLDGVRNPVGEQIPPPHTWDPELSISLVDDDTTSLGETSEIETVLSEHGRRGPREGTRERLQRVQGLTPRASSLDIEEEESVQEVRGRREVNDYYPTESSASFGCQAAAARRSRQAKQACARRVWKGLASWNQNTVEEVPQVHFQEERDSRYHGNDKRADGCPLDHDGCATFTPIYVPVKMNTKDENTFLGSAEGEFAASCVMAHAAILSSLFVQGRTVHFSSNHSSLLLYIQRVFHEFIELHALCISYRSLLQEDGGADVSSGELCPYYPAWCTRELLVLLPPHPTSAAHGSAPSFSRGEVDAITGTILQSLFLPSSVVTIAAPRSASGEKGEKCIGGNVRWPSYVQVIKTCVEEQLKLFFPEEVENGKHRKLQWISLPPPYDERDLSSTRNQEGGAHHCGISAFLHQLGLLSEHFYAVQLLYAPSNSVLAPWELSKLAWNGFSPDTRLVGINTSLWHSLLFFPHVPFLSHKVGNCFRYRAVDRVVVSRQQRFPFSFIKFKRPFLPFQRFQEKAFSHRPRRLPCFHSGLPLLPFPTSTHPQGNISPAQEAPPNTTIHRSESFCRSSREVASSQQPRRAHQTYQHSPPHLSASASFLPLERLIDYLAQSSAYSILALCVARWFRL